MTSPKNMICIHATDCPMNVKKEGKAAKNPEFCAHMTPHECDNGCKITICGHMRNVPCGCIVIVEKKEEKKLEAPMATPTLSPA